MKSIQLAFACLAALMAQVAAADGGIKVELAVPSELHQGEPLPVEVRVQEWGETLC